MKKLILVKSCLFAFLKGAELDVKHQKYKGRMYFSEQGTSASHMAASNFLSALSRMPGMSAEDADAASAYTQADLGGPP
eukprot:2457865-Karenia_brevis.AAC.1